MTDSVFLACKWVCVCVGEKSNPFSENEVSSHAFPSHFSVGQALNWDLKLGRLLELGNWGWGHGNDLSINHRRFFPTSPLLSLPFSLLWFHWHEDQLLGNELTGIEFIWAELSSPFGGKSSDLPNHYLQLPKQMQLKSKWGKSLTTLEDRHHSQKAHHSHWCAFSSVQSTFWKPNTYMVFIEIL